MRCLTIIFIYLVGHKGAAAWISKDGASTVYERLVRSVSLYSQPSLSEQRPRRHDQNLTTTTVSTTTISSTTISTTTIGDGECASFQSLCCNGKCINTAYVDDGEKDCSDGTDETDPPLQCSNNTLGCRGFGREVNGICDYSLYEKASMIRCTGHTHFVKWQEKERKRVGKNHKFVENVSFVEYFKHEYTRYGKRPAEGPSGFGGMYVPGKNEACIKVRDTLNTIFDPPAWACTPVCLNKWNTRSKCNGLSRRNRRIRRMDSNTSPDRYVLKHRNNTDDEPDDDAPDIVRYGLVGDGWKGGLRNRETDDDVADAPFKRWRKRTRVVGLDYTDCECQNEGDNHLTYDMIPDEFGLPVLPPLENLTQGDEAVSKINLVRVGAAGAGAILSVSDLTLGGKYTFSCNPITDDPLSFQNSFNEGCMDVCHKSVKSLRSLTAMGVLEENGTFTPFYISVGILIPLFFVGCLLVAMMDSEDEEVFDNLNTSFVLTCKFFDWTSDWAFYAISLHSPRFTETSEMGEHSTNEYRAGWYKGMQKASLGFCLVGTVLVFAEWIFIAKKGKEAKLYKNRSYIGICIILLEDIPQLTLCGLYLDSLYAETRFSLSSDKVTTISIIMSSISLVYNVIKSIKNFTKGKNKEAEDAVDLGKEQVQAQKDREILQARVEDLKAQGKRDKATEMKIEKAEAKVKEALVKEEKLKEEVAQEKQKVADAEAKRKQSIKNRKEKKQTRLQEKEKKTEEAKKFKNHAGEATKKRTEAETKLEELNKTGIPHDSPAYREAEAEILEAKKLETEAISKLIEVTPMPSTTFQPAKKSARSCAHISGKGKGKCRDTSLAGSNRCSRHTCEKEMCNNPKNGNDAFCNDHQDDQGAPAFHSKQTNLVQSLLSGGGSRAGGFAPMGMAASLVGGFGDAELLPPADNTVGVEEAATGTNETTRSPSGKARETGIATVAVTSASASETGNDEGFSGFNTAKPDYKPTEEKATAASSSVEESPATDGSTEQQSYLVIGAEEFAGFGGESGDHNDV